jgi:hypothetical protein
VAPDAARHGVPARIGLDQDPARSAANDGVIGRLDPVEPLAICPHVAEKMSGEIQLRVIAAVFLDEAHAVQAERRDLPRFVRRHLTLDEGERALTRETIAERASIACRAFLEYGAEPRGRLLRLRDLGWHRVDRFGIDAVSENVAVPVHDLAAFGRRLDGAQLLPLGARRQLPVLGDLQIEETGLDAQTPHGKDRSCDRDARAHGCAPRDGDRRWGFEVVHEGPRGVTWLRRRTCPADPAQRPAR